MKKIVISEEELEMMNYNDIAHIVLEENKKKMPINELFKEVCNILGTDVEAEQSHILDLFELLSTDKRFIMLEDGNWDLKIKHNKGMIIDEEDEDEDELVIEESDDGENEEENYDDENKSDDDIEEDDLADLVIIDDTEEDNLM